MLDTFWAEYQDFENKVGPYSGRDYIWNSVDIREGNSHIWHSKNTLRHTKILGKLGCRVCSKILGIGTAERSWGDVKHLKTGKRSHLSGDRVKKQATIFGVSCIERKEAMMKTRLEEDRPIKYMTEEDFDREFDMLDDDANKKKKGTRFFRMFKEDWEEKAYRKQDPVSQAALLAKYGGLQWYDIDQKCIHFSDDKELDWKKLTRGGGGYHLITYSEHYNDDDPNKDKHKDVWTFVDDLRWSIGEYYKKHPEMGVTVVEKEQDEIDEGDEQYKDMIE